MAQVVDARASGTASYSSAGSTRRPTNVFFSSSSSFLFFLSKRPLNKTCTINTAKINR